MARMNRRGHLAEKHGCTHTKTYKSWTDMKKRCDDMNRKEYKNYGGRGISYDDKWEYFSQFLKDMGHKPDGDYALDRIDNNGNYCKENCRWIKQFDNNQNKGMAPGLRGTYKHSRDDKYVSQIKIDRFNYYLGVFDSEEEAHQEYKKVFIEWHGIEPKRNKELKREV